MLVEGFAAGVAATATAAGPITLVVTLVLQVIADPPGFPVPLHWLTVTGIARLTRDEVSTVQCTMPPPPLAEPLHWVTIAPALAWKGWQPALPPPEPTHWLTVAPVRGLASGVPSLMVFVMVTAQSIVCAASLSELLHCRTVVTRLADSVLNVPFGVEQGPRVHSRVTVVVE